MVVGPGGRAPVDEATGLGRAGKVGDRAVGVGKPTQDPQVRPGVSEARPVTKPRDRGV